MWTENWTGWLVEFIYLFILLSYSFNVVNCLKLIFFNKIHKMFIYRFKSWGGKDPYRTAEDLAYAVARFFQFGGTFQNYYMVGCCYKFTFLYL